MSTGISDTLARLRDEMAKELFDMTHTEATTRCICARCRKKMSLDMPAAELKWFFASAVCADCTKEMNAKHKIPNPPLK